MTDGFQNLNGEWVAADEIANVKYQRVKTLFGSNDTATEVSPTNPLPVTLISLGSVTVTPISAATAATGTNWTPLASQAGNALDLCNNSGTAIEYRRVGTTPTFAIATATWRKIVGITNANQIEIRRVDTSNTQVTVTAEVLS